MANTRDVSMATINAFNLHDWDGHTYSRQKTAFPDKTAWERRVAWLADMVQRVEADLIGFQEIWSVAALQAVFDEAGLSGEYDLHARDAPGLGKPQVALAVRRGWTIDTPRWMADFPAAFRISGLREQNGAEEPISVSIGSWSRPILQCQIQPVVARKKPPVIDVYVAHLKSKAPSRLVTVDEESDVLQAHGGIARSAVAHIRRVLEAGALRAHLDGVMPETDDKRLSPTVVMGDLNDATHAVSTELLSAQPGYRLTAASRAGSRSDKGLYSVETLQQYRSQRDVYYTYVYRNKNETLDHILVSEEFYDHSRKRHWSFSETEIYNDHLAYADEPKSVKDRLLRETGAIDHGVVRARFAWDPIEEDIRRAARALERSA